MGVSAPLLCGLNSGSQAWRRTLLPQDPSLWPTRSYFCWLEGRVVLSELIISGNGARGIGLEELGVGSEFSRGGSKLLRWL